LATANGGWRQRFQYLASPVASSDRRSASLVNLQTVCKQLFRWGHSAVVIEVGHERREPEPSVKRRLEYEPTRIPRFFLGYARGRIGYFEISPAPILYSE
jgi:hypothetical protein